MKAIASTRRLDRKGLRQNRLALRLEQAAAYIRARRIPFIRASVAAAVLLVAGTGYWGLREWKERQAEDLLGEASVAARKLNRPETGKPLPTDAQFVVGRYLETARRYSGTRAAEVAQYQAANLFAAYGQLAEAIARYDKYLGTYPRGRFASLAALGKAYALENTGDLKGANAHYQLLIERFPEAAVTPDAYTGLARTAQGLNRPDEAAKAYTQVIEKYPQTPWGTAALDRLSGMKRGK